MDIIKSKKISRRSFICNASALAALSCLPGSMAKAAVLSSKPNSLYAGVQIGAISYSYRSLPGGAKNTIDYLLKSGLSSVELMGYTIEEYAGIPNISVPDHPKGTKLTDEQKEEIKTKSNQRDEAQRKWRLSAPMKKFKALRKMFNDAGINIDIAKIGSPNWSDAEIDYAFSVAKVLGARGISMEVSNETAKRMAPFAEKHKLYVILHNHGQPGQPGFSFEEILSHGKYVALNFDVGHYYGATGKHPNGIIEKHHDQIISLHMKDKTGLHGEPPNQNKPWGEGETPIADILLLLKEKGWPITVDIELEYPIPDGSDAIAEVKKCHKFCKAILVG